MLNPSELTRYSDALAGLLSALSSLGFPLETIEEMVLSSHLLASYEEGDDSLSWEEVGTLFAKEWQLAIMPERFAASDFFLWIGEAYLRLFYETGKPFGAIFAYLPLPEMAQIYGVYHEMDWTELSSYFEEKRKENVLLRLLLKKKGMTKEDLSIKSGVNVNSIDRYCRNDDYLSSASLDNAYRIAKALGVNPTLFVSKISVFYHKKKESPYVESLHRISDFFLSTLFQDYGPTDFFLIAKEEDLEAMEPGSNKIAIVYYQGMDVVLPKDKLTYQKLFLMDGNFIEDFDSLKKKVIPEPLKKTV